MGRVQAREGSQGLWHIALDRAETAHLRLQVRRRGLGVVSVPASVPDATYLPALLVLLAF